MFMAEVLNVVHVDLGTLVLSRGHHLYPFSLPPNAHDIAIKDSSGVHSSEGCTTACSAGSSSSGSLNTVHVLLDEAQIGRGRIGRVYRGRIQLPGGSSTDLYSPPSTNVVVKLVIPQGRVKGVKLYPKGHDGRDILFDLAKEASIYSLMHEVQGTVVPYCYGYYHSENEACLVLEDCGVDLKFPYRRLELQARRTLFEHQKKLHQVGVSQGDVARRNFVKGPRGIRLVDFDRAVPHQCPGFEEPTFEESSTTESAAEIFCPELRKLFRAFGLLPMEYYLLREREAYKPWNGEPW